MKEFPGLMKWICPWGSDEYEVCRSKSRKIERISSSSPSPNCWICSVICSAHPTAGASAKDGLKCCREWELDPCVPYTANTKRCRMCTQSECLLEQTPSHMCSTGTSVFCPAQQYRLSFSAFKLQFRKQMQIIQQWLFCVCVRLLLRIPDASTNWWVLKIANSVRGKRQIWKDTKCNLWKQKKKAA